MAKSKPIGVRFDPILLEVLKEDCGCETPQQALNFLSKFWNDNRPGKINFEEKFKDMTFEKPKNVIQASNKPQGGTQIQNLNQPSKVRDLSEKRLETNYGIDTTSKPEKMLGESGIDYAIRLAEWKSKKP